MKGDTTADNVQALGILSEGVAHHFNNLLSVVLGYASFVAHREPELAEESISALRRICEEAQRGRRLTADLLEFSSVAPEDDSAMSRVHEVINTVADLLEFNAPVQVKLSKELAVLVDEVGVRRSALHQLVYLAFVQMLGTVPQGGFLRVATMDRDVSGHGSFCQLLFETTSDNEKVQGDPEREALLYEQASDCGGTMLASFDETGALLELLLPVVGDSAPSPEPVLQDPPAVADAVIWVVDDDANFLEMCSVVLEDSAAAVEPLDGGTALMERWGSDAARPDLIVIDFSMPDYNGYELCQWLDEQGAEMPIILVSGLASRHPDITRACAYSNVNYLGKPFSFYELNDAVAMALAERYIS